jgi:hypothetical protein
MILGSWGAEMRRSRIIACILCLLILAGCSENAGVHDGEEIDIVLEETEVPEETDIPDEIDVYENELCHCGEHKIGESLRQPTPPVNFREEHEVDSEFLNNFDNVYTCTYIQFETEFYSTLYIWTDEPLYDFSFVSLDVAGHYWHEDRLLVINTQEVLLNIPVLLPADAVVLNVAFAHYLLPHGAIIYTDEQGEMWRMLIGQNMRGGCYPLYGLGFPDNEWLNWVD